MMIRRIQPATVRSRQPRRPWAWGGKRLGRSVRVWLAAGVGMLLPGMALSAPTPEENAAWDQAARLFQVAAYDLAERDLQAFLERYPGSEKAAEAGLLLGEARFQRKDYEGALAVVRGRLDGAGTLADQYRFWAAECLSHLNRLEEAIAEYAAVVSGYPTSGRRLDAVVGQAFALRGSGKAREAFELLARPDGVLLSAVTTQGGSETLARGLLLLGETALATGQAAAGEALLTRGPAEAWSVALGWERDYLLARLQDASGKLDAAANTAVALVTRLEAQTNAPALQVRADAIALAGGLLDRKGDSTNALALFERNLAPGVSPERRRDAAVQVARIAVERLGSSEAGARLESFLAQYPEDTILDPLRIALAELGLRRYLGTPSKERAALVQSLAQIRQRLMPVITQSTGGIQARAQFASGWCGWEIARGSGNTNLLEETARAFEGAAAGLPRSVEQAVARFKAGDCRYALSQHPAAVAHYWQVATNYPELPEVRRGLADHALHQMVRSAGVLEDLELGDRAMRLLLESYPETFYGERSVLLYGQTLGEAGHPANARRLFTDFLVRFPGSSEAARLKLAIAWTWRLEGNWSEAATMYESWLEAHPDHPLRGQARYELAWSMGRAGDEARAFQQFTNFLASFPRHERAQDAQYWVASYHFSQDRFDLAENGYQRVFQDTNWPPSEVTFRARMMAGRSAYRRTSYREARTYFLDLINTNCPVHLLPEAYFLLGHTIRDGAAATNKLGSLVAAIDAYGRVPMNYPESPWVPLAWLEVGNCRLQLATEDYKQYDDALAAYTNVLASALADVAARSQAEVGMAICLEKKAAPAPTTAERSAMLTEALAHYLNVTEGGNLRDGENADLFWVERAASGGGQLAEQLRRWEVAERLYLRFKESVPQFREKYEARLQQLRRKMSP